MEVTKFSPENATWNTKSAIFGSILVDRNEAAWLLICWQCATYKGFLEKRRRSHLRGLRGQGLKRFCRQVPLPHSVQTSSMLWIFLDSSLRKMVNHKSGLVAMIQPRIKQLARSVPILFDGVVGNQEHGSGRCRMRCRGGAGRHGSATRELWAAL